MTEMKIGGAAFNVLVEGEEGAPVLVLAHSLGTNLHVFDGVTPELLRRFRVVRYDGRGHGSSVVTPGPYALPELGGDALAILEALGVEKVHWLGLSLGGMVGLWLLTHAPERIGRAVLANVAAQFGSPDMWNERIRMAREKGLEPLAPAVLDSWFTRAFRDHHPREVEHLRQMLLATPAEGYASACAALRDMDQREAIPAIPNPVLVIVGRHDPITPPGVGALVASAIPGAKLATLETAHLSCVEDPAGFGRAALEFLTVEEMAMAEESPQEEAQEASHMPPPTKKPRKPRAPRKPPAAMEAEGGHTSAAASEHDDGEHEPDMHSEHEHEPEHEPPAQSAPLPKPRKPRQPRAAKAAPAAAPEPPPVIAAAAPQPRKRPVKKAAAKKAPVKKAPAKKAAAKKPAAKRSSARKAVARKAPAKKSALRTRRPAAPARKAVTKKTVGKKSVAKKAVKKTASKKAATRKTAVKKGLVRKAVVKKTQAKKAGVKKTAVKKAAARKPLPRRLPGRRPAARKR